MVFGENHHLFVGHLGKQRCIFMKTKTLQPGRDIYRQHMKTQNQTRVLSFRSPLNGVNVRTLVASPGWRRPRPPTFHATAVLLEGVPRGPLVLRLLAAGGGHAALGGEGGVVRGPEGLPQPCVVLARPLRATGLGPTGDQGHGLLQGAWQHLAQSWQKKHPGETHIQSVNTCCMSSPGLCIASSLTPQPPLLLPCSPKKHPSYALILFVRPAT